jgi:probable metal-binding protein
MEQIHGHEVIQMMMQSGKAYTRASLLADIVSTFGPTARFYTCSAQDLTPDGLIDFLEARGKFADRDNGFEIAADRVCKH